MKVAQIADLRGGQSVAGTFLVTWIGSHKSDYRLQEVRFRFSTIITGHFSQAIGFSLFTETQILTKNSDYSNPNNQQDTKHDLNQPMQSDG